MYKLLKRSWPKKWPSENKWKRFPEVLNIKEKVVLFGLVIIAVSSFFYISFSFYFLQTAVSPAKGGSYREGFIGSPMWLSLNPIYSSRNDAERDITEILFSGLMRYDNQGNIIPHLISEYSIEDNRVFTIQLKENLFWSDGKRITADDVLFTVDTIQDPAFKSTLRQSWVGVQIEKLSDLEIRFKIDAPSSIFLENLTLKIIPKHIWQEVPSREFPFAIHIEAVGSGAYRLKSIKENSLGGISLVILERNPYYFGQTPYIDQLSFIFFNSREEVLVAEKNKEIDGFALLDATNGYSGTEGRSLKRYDFILPRYFALLFNMESGGVVGDINVRKALNYATNKKDVLEKVIKGNGQIINSPLLLDLYDIDSPYENYSYHPEKARELLYKAGFENGVKIVKDQTVFMFEKDIREKAQGDDVRALQRCFISLNTKHPELYPEGEITGFFDDDTKDAVIYFQEIYREDILDPWGFDKGTGMVSTTTREKLNELCSTIPGETVSLNIEIITVDQPTLTGVANELAKQWEKLGIQVNIIEKDINSLEKDIIRKREYESLLFGTALTGILNPLPLWHSSKIEDPGLNLSGYNNSKADQLMEEIIKTEEGRIEALTKLQEEIMEEAPGIFLYNPILIYFVSEKVKGIESSFLVDSSRRFQNIEEWYINTKRKLK